MNSAIGQPRVDPPRAWVDDLAMDPRLEIVRRAFAACDRLRFVDWTADDRLHRLPGAAALARVGF